MKKSTREKKETKRGGIDQSLSDKRNLEEKGTRRMKYIPRRNRGGGGGEIWAEGRKDIAQGKQKSDRGACPSGLVENGSYIYSAREEAQKGRPRRPPSPGGCIYWAGDQGGIDVRQWDGSGFFLK